MTNQDSDLAKEFHQLLGMTRSYLYQMKNRDIFQVPHSIIKERIQKLTQEPVSIQTAPLVSVLPNIEKSEPPLKRSLSILADYPELPHPFLGKGKEGLEQIQDILGNCTRCRLHQGRTNLVFGTGNPNANLVFVGEGPGAEEDRTGFPFVGAAGDLLTRMIMAMGFSREQVYICNVVKCRPPGNRTPEPDEIFHCGPFLRSQIQAIHPKVIVALGRTPTQFLLQTQAPISKTRGQFAKYEGIPVMPTYHPAYLLRTPSAKRQVWEDLKLVVEKLKEV